MIRWLKIRWHRLFPGRWTQAEIDDIHSRAEERYQRMKDFID